MFVKGIRYVDGCFITGSVRSLTFPNKRSKWNLIEYESQSSYDTYTSTIRKTIKPICPIMLDKITLNGKGFNIIYINATKFHEWNQVKMENYVK